MVVSIFGCSSKYVFVLKTIVQLIVVGTYRIKQPEIIDSVVRQAVKCGYRLIDSAAVYKNEEAIGKTIKSIIEDTSSGLKREDFFITSKLGGFLRLIDSVQVNKY